MALRPQSKTRWVLPPLILHPFSDPSSPQKLVRSSRASLMLQGLLPNDGSPIEQLEQIVLEGRTCEVRMLYYVGKDVERWLEQCIDMCEREPELRGGGALQRQSFAALLIEETPANVRGKLADWGVQDYRAIFCRAIGLNCIFGTAPDSGQLAGEFVQNYHRYADAMFRCWHDGTQFTKLDPAEWEFDLYASGEYSRMLEQQWGGDSESEET